MIDLLLAATKAAVPAAKGAGTGYSLTMGDFLQYFPMEDVFSLKVYLDAMMKYPWVWGLIFFWIGCNIGSFLNVCIYRLPLGMSLLHPGSHCPKCGHKLGLWENVPIFSYIFLLGRCKECDDSISPRYIIVEFMVGVLFALIYLKVRGSGQHFLLLPMYYYIAAIAVVAAFTDAETRLIPNSITYPAFVIAPLFFLLKSKLMIPYQFDLRTMLLSIISGLTVWILLSLFARLGKKMFGREAFGGGDVKYVAALAACVGPLPAVLILLFACVIAVIGISVFRAIVPKRKNRPFAFGPFISASVLLWIFFGYLILPKVLHFYPMSFSRLCLL